MLVILDFQLCLILLLSKSIDLNPNAKSYNPTHIVNIDYDICMVMD